METGFQEAQCPWLSRCSRGSLAGKIPISIAMNSVLLWNFVLCKFRLMKPQCRPRVKMAVALCCHLVAKCYIAFPSESDFTTCGLPSAGPPANVQNWEVWPVLSIMCHRNFFILLMFSSPLWSTSLLPLVPRVLSFLFPSVQGQEQEQEQLTSSPS